MKKKQVLLTLIAVLSLVVITVGVSYSLFTYSRTGTTDNIVKTGKINFLYTEVSGIGKGISLTDSFPISDEEGKIQTGEGKVFDFKVTSTIEMNSNIKYEVTARKKSDSTLDEGKVKLYLTEVDGIEKELLLDKYYNLEQTSTKVPEGTVEKTIYEGTVPANTSNYEKNFRLRMWIDNDADFSQGNMNNKTFAITVNVYSTGKVVDGNLDTDNSLKSLSVDNCTLLPAFSTEVTEYSCTVKNDIASIMISAEANSSNAKIKGMGSKNLTVGENNLPVRVIAEDGNEKIYTLKITRKAPAQSLKNEIMKNTIITSSPTLTTSSNNTSDASGLYKSTATNTGNPTYYFRGNVINNYVTFAGYTWRIVRINEDGTIRIVMQDGINNNATYQFNLNYNSYNYMYYTNSQSKSMLENWYQTNIGSKSELAQNVVTGDYYCEQAKVKYDSKATSGSASMTLYSSYAPDFKCIADGNGRGIVNANIGLITYDEVVHAGGYFNQNNSDYYLNNSKNFRTMSPAGFYGSSAYLWYVSMGYNIHNGFVSNYTVLRPVLNLKADTLATGSGTSGDPFVVE